MPTGRGAPLGGAGPRGAPGEEAPPLTLLSRHAEPTEAAPLLRLRPPRLLLRPDGRGGHRPAAVAQRHRAVPHRGRAGQRHGGGAGQVPRRAELRALPRGSGEAVRPGGEGEPLLR